MLVNFVTLVFGIRIWRVPLMTYFFGDEYGTTLFSSWISLHNALFFGVVLSSIPTIYSNVANVIKAANPVVDLESGSGSEEAFRLRERYAKISPIQSLVPFLTLVVCWLIWMYFSPADLMINYTFLSCSTFGLTTAYLVTRMVLGRVSDEVVPKFYYILVPLPFLTLIAFLSEVAFTARFGAAADFDVYALMGYLVYVLVFYAHMVYDVIENITEHLGIYCFSLVKRNQQQL